MTNTTSSALAGRSAGWPSSAEAAHTVVQEAKNAGVWVFGGEWGAGPLFRDHPNVHFEFCTSSPEQGLIVECLRAVGPRRVLFGSDADLISPLYVLGAYADAEISEADAQLIYAGNAERLFGL